MGIGGDLKADAETEIVFCCRKCGHNLYLKVVKNVR